MTDNPDPSAHYPAQEPINVGARGRCPRCGEGRLFAGFLTLAPACKACGLDFDFADSADGPAVFVILIVGFIVAGGALIVELSYEPPFWVHFILWVPLILILSFGTLRPLKGIMIALQYVNRARQGEWDRPS